MRDEPVLRGAMPVVVDNLLAQLGFFAALPVLPLFIERMSTGMGAALIGVALFSFNFAVRGGSLFLSWMLHRTTVRLAMCSGLLMGGAGFALLTVAPGDVGIVCCLPLAGLGVSVNGLAVRTYVTMTFAESGARSVAFGAIQVAANISAAVGPIVANILVGANRYTLLLLLVAAMYLLAAGFVGATIPATLRPSDRDVRKPLSLGLFTAVFTDPGIRRVSAVAAIGSFLYGQFFSALVLQMTLVTSSPLVRASFFTVNAILVVVLQVPVTRQVRSGLDRGVGSLRYLLLGIAMFSVSDLVFGVAGWAIAGLFAGIAIFSLAETYFTPMVNTAYAEIAGDRPVVEAFNLRQVAVSVGESLGAFCGGALFLSTGSVYWIAMAVLGLAATVLWWRSAPVATPMVVKES